MAGKPGSGGGGPTGGGNDFTPTGGDTPRLGDVDGQLTVDTTVLRNGAERYTAYGDHFRNFPSHHRYLVQPPIKRGLGAAEDDEAFRNFWPTYKAAGDAIMDAVVLVGTAIQGVRDGLVNLADAHEKTEDNAVEIGRNALTLTGRPPGGDDATGNPPSTGDGGPDLSSLPPARGKSLDDDGQGRFTNPSAVLLPSRPGGGGTLLPSGEVVTPGVVPDGRIKGVELPDGGAPGDGPTTPDRAPHGGFLRSEVRIPLKPQELMNANGERIGVLAPLGADVPGSEGRLTLLTLDGRPKGFFQPYGDHRFDEAVQGEATPAVRYVRGGEPQD